MDLDQFYLDFSRFPRTRRTKKVDFFDEDLGFVREVKWRQVATIDCKPDLCAFPGGEAHVAFPFAFLLNCFYFASKVVCFCAHPVPCALVCLNFVVMECESLNDAIAHPNFDFKGLVTDKALSKGSKLENTNGARFCFRNGQFSFLLAA